MSPVSGSPEAFFSGQEQEKLPVSPKLQEIGLVLVTMNGIFQMQKGKILGDRNEGKTIEHYLKAPFMYSANQMLIF